MHHKHVKLSLVMLLQSQTDEIVLERTRDYDLYNGAQNFRVFIGCGCLLTQRTRHIE